jgi:hypothetical protein
VRTNCNSRGREATKKSRLVFGGKLAHDAGTLNFQRE